MAVKKFWPEENFLIQPVRVGPFPLFKAIVLHSSRNKTDVYCALLTQNINLSSSVDTNSTMQVPFADGFPHRASLQDQFAPISVSSYTMKTKAMKKKPHEG